MISRFLTQAVSHHQSGCVWLGKMRSNVVLIQSDSMVDFTNGTLEILQNSVNGFFCKFVALLFIYTIPFTTPEILFYAITSPLWLPCSCSYTLQCPGALAHRFHSVCLRRNSWNGGEPTVTSQTECSGVKGGIFTWGNHNEQFPELGLMMESIV